MKRLDLGSWERAGRRELRSEGKSRSMTCAEEELVEFLGWQLSSPFLTLHLRRRRCQAA